MPQTVFINQTYVGSGQSAFDPLNPEGTKDRQMRDDDDDLDAEPGVEPVFFTDRIPGTTEEHEHDENGESAYLYDTFRRPPVNVTDPANFGVFSLPVDGDDFSGPGVEHDNEILLGEAVFFGVTEDDPPIIEGPPTVPVIAEFVRHEYVGADGGTGTVESNGDTGTVSKQVSLSRDGPRINGTEFLIDSVSYPENEFAVVTGPTTTEPCSTEVRSGPNVAGFNVVPRCGFMPFSGDFSRRFLVRTVTETWPGILPQNNETFPDDLTSPRNQTFVHRFAITDSGSGGETTVWEHDPPESDPYTIDGTPWIFKIAPVAGGLVNSLRWRPRWWYYAGDGQQAANPAHDDPSVLVPDPGTDGPGSGLPWSPEAYSGTGELLYAVPAYRETLEVLDDTRVRFRRIFAASSGVASEVVNEVVIELSEELNDSDLTLVNRESYKTGLWGTFAEPLPWDGLDSKPAWLSDESELGQLLSHSDYSVVFADVVTPGGFAIMRQSAENADILLRLQARFRGEFSGSLSLTYRETVIDFNSFELREQDVSLTVPLDDSAPGLEWHVPLSVPQSPGTVVLVSFVRQSWSGDTLWETGPRYRAV